MKHFNLTIIKGATNRSDPISLNTKLVPEPAQELRTFRRQSKRDRYHEIAARFLQKATKETKVVIDLELFVIFVSFCWTPLGVMINRILLDLRRSAQRSSSSPPWPGLFL